MLKRRERIAVSVISAMLLVLSLGAVWGQVSSQPAQPAAVSSQDIWQLVPSNSVLVVAYDGRPENSSVQVLSKTVSAEQRQKQQAAMKMAAQDFTTLFGVSFDFARDIDPWLGHQWAFVWLPDGAGEKAVINGKPVFMISSVDASSANQALTKIIAPWERLGTVTAQNVAGCDIRSFKSRDGKVELFASACGPVVAVSSSVPALTAALNGKGFTPDTPAAKVFNSLSGSIYYAYADITLVKGLGDKNMQIPVDAFGMGLSAIETGTQFRILGLANEQSQTLAKQFFPALGTGPVMANQGIPATSLVVATVPDLTGALDLVSAFSGGKNPMMDFASVLRGTQTSVALTAVLPVPAGVVSSASVSEQAAAEKALIISNFVKSMKLAPGAPVQIDGFQASSIKIPNGMTLLWAQKGQYIVVASDQLSLANSINAASDGQSITDVAAYKETMAGLGNSNLQTLYINLAPVQGIGYLIQGLGLDRWVQPYGIIADYLENVQALGFGTGWDGQMASATFFLRARPGVPGAIVPATTAVAAAVLFPVFARSREAARVSSCQSNMKQLALAAIMYADDHSGKLPSRTNWQAELQPYTRTRLTCPTSDGKTCYAFNKNLSGLNINKIQNPSEVVMFFEARTDLPNASGSRADALLPHYSQGCFAYVDGHVERTGEIPSQYHWVPKYKGAAPKSTAKPVVKGRKR